MVEGKMMQIQMDTGASCNVISESDLRKTGFDFKQIKDSKVILKTYDGSKLNILGRALISCDREGKKFKALFYVVKGNLKPLLSAETCLR